MPSPLPAGLLFDLDGTLVETDPTHLAAFNDMLGPYGDHRGRAFLQREHHRLPQRRHLHAASCPASRSLTACASPTRRRRCSASRAGGLEAGPRPPRPPRLGRCERRRDVVVTNAPRANALMMLGALGIDRPVSRHGHRRRNGRPQASPAALPGRAGAAGRRARTTPSPSRTHGPACPLGRRRRADAWWACRPRSTPRPSRRAGAAHRGARFHRSRPDLARARTDRYGLTP